MKKASDLFEWAKDQEGYWEAYNALMIQEELLRIMKVKKITKNSLCYLMRWTAKDFKEFFIDNNQNEIFFSDKVTHTSQKVATLDSCIQEGK